MYFTKKGEFMQLSHQVFHARHLLFNWKQETRRERSPSAPIAFEKSNKTIGSNLTPPLDFRKSRKVGLTLISRKYQRMHIRKVHPKV